MAFEFITQLLADALPDGSEFILFTIIFIVGLVVLIKASDTFVEGAASIAKRRGVSDHLIGLTLVALATSLPELAVSSVASAGGNSDLALGNVLGSNIANTCLVLGTGAILMKMAPSKESLRDGFVMLGVVLLLYIMMASGNTVSRIEGLALLSIYVIYSYVLFKYNKDLAEEAGIVNPLILSQEERQWLMSVSKVNKEKKEAKMDWGRLILGAFFTVMGADFLVFSSIGYATMFGVDPIIVGLTIVAIGTSLPELATTVAAALKNNPGIAVGNVVGSNIINIVLVLGTASAISAIAVDQFSLNITMSLLGAVSLLMIYFMTQHMDKRHGVLLLSLYGSYLLLLYLHVQGFL